jgi:hypothetical protein
MKNLSKESRCPGRNSNRIPMEYESKAPPLRQPTRSRSIFSDIFNLNFNLGCKSTALPCKFHLQFMFTDFKTTRGDVNVPDGYGTRHCEGTSLRLKGGVRFKCNSQTEIKVSPRN